MADPYRYFRVEAAEILEQLQKGLLELERGAPPAEIVARLLRLAHTLKGAARVVKQKGIADLSHSVEDLLVPIRDSGRAVDASFVATALQHVDAMRAQLQALTEPSANPEPAAAQAAVRVDEPFWAAPANTEELAVLMDGIGELNVRLGGVRETRARLEHARSLAELLRDQLATRRRPHSTEAELVRLRSLAEELETVLVATERQVSSNVEPAVRELAQIRDAAERLRLVPAANVWGSLERTARDAALSLGKRVRFEAKGGDVRLEAELLAQVQRALVQAVRNAVAHGIEDPAARVSARKSAEGVVTVCVVQRDGQAVFSCRDDGQGLNLDAVRRSAERRGITPVALSGLDADGLARLLLRGGISTASSVSAVSGRGIGLDLIREVAESVGGAVSLKSSKSGTTLELAVPVSLAALSALLVEVSGQVVALPLFAVRGTARHLAHEVTHTADGDSVALDGKVISYVGLDRLLNADTPDATRGANRSAVMVSAGGATVAVGVERLLGIESIVVRGMPELALMSPVVSGASFDADGTPRIVLSPEGVVSAAERAAAAPRAAAKLRAPILVIDDSLTTRMLEQSILESAGFEVDLAVSGEEGLDKARMRKYALFLVDVEMPGMDGFSFIERTRADPELRQVPSILVTSRASAEDVERGRAAGALAHIEKREFNQTDLLERIRKLVN